MKEESAFSDANAAGRQIARLGGRTVEVDVGRVRSYPGLPSEAPDTRGYYALAVEELAGATHVLDVGAGSGNGARILRAAFPHVVALDSAREAVEFARAHAPGVTVLRGDASDRAQLPTADAAVFVDVLGHARDPRAVLRAVHARLAPGALVLVAEARAYPSQSLRAPARRAFSPRALDALLEAMGFEVTARPGETGPFVVVVARAVAGADPDALVAAAQALGQGDVESAMTHLDRAAESGQKAVRVDALVTLGELRLALGDGDGAARAFLAARTADDREPRAAAGLARLTLAMGDRADGVALARIAHNLDPTCSSTAYVLARALDGADDALKDGALRTAAALSPDDEGLAMQFAASSGRRGAAKPGIFALERTRRYGDPLPAAFHVLLGELLLAEGRRQDAVLEARLAEAVGPREPEVARLWSRLRTA